jgi:hypothetical protein
MSHDLENTRVTADRLRLTDEIDSAIVEQAIDASVLVVAYRKMAALDRRSKLYGHYAHVARKAERNLRKALHPAVAETLILRLYRAA